MKKKRVKDPPTQLYKMTNHIQTFSLATTVITRRDTNILEVTTSTLDKVKTPMVLIQEHMVTNNSYICLAATMKIEHITPIMIILVTTLQMALTI